MKKSFDVVFCCALMLSTLISLESQLFANSDDEAAGSGAATGGGIELVLPTELKFKDSIQSELLENIKIQGEKIQLVSKLVDVLANSNLSENKGSDQELDDHLVKIKGNLENFYTCYKSVFKSDLYDEEGPFKAELSSESFQDSKNWVNQSLLGEIFNIKQSSFKRGDCIKSYANYYESVSFIIENSELIKLIQNRYEKACLNSAKDMSSSVSDICTPKILDLIGLLYSPVTRNTIYPDFLTRVVKKTKKVYENFFKTPMKKIPVEEDINLLKYFIDDVNFEIKKRSVPENQEKCLKSLSKELASIKGDEIEKSELFTSQDGIRKRSDWSKDIINNLFEQETTDLKIPMMSSQIPWNMDKYTIFQTSKIKEIGHLVQIKFIPKSISSEKKSVGYKIDLEFSDINDKKCSLKKRVQKCRVDVNHKNILEMISKKIGIERTCSFNQHKSNRDEKIPYSFTHCVEIL